MLFFQDLTKLVFFYLEFLDLVYYKDFYDIMKTKVEDDTILGLHGQIFITGGLHGWLLWEEARGCPHVSESQVQPPPTDPLQDAAQPVSDAGGVSVIARLRMCKKRCTAAKRDKWETCERNSPAYTRVSEEEGGGTGAEIVLQPVMKTMVRQVVALQPMEAHGGAHTHTAAHGGPHNAVSECALKAAVIHGEPT